MKQDIFPELSYYTLGGHIPDPRPIIEDVKAGEHLGLRHVWISERPGTKHIGALCGAAAAAAPKSVIGSGIITNLQTRNPLDVASFASTMTLLTSNKFILGMGRGQPQLPAMMGKPNTTFPLLKRYLSALQALWRGETVTASGDGWELNNARLGTTLETPPKIYMAAVGDKTLEFAGEHCDGVMLMSCLTAEAVRHSTEIIRRGAEKAGRDPDSVDICAHSVTACDVSEEKLLNYVVRRLNSYFVLPHLRNAVCEVNGWDLALADKIGAEIVASSSSSAGLGDEGISKDMDELRRFYEKVYPREWLDSSNAMGTGEDGAKFMRSLMDAGATRIIVHGNPMADFGSVAKAWSQHRPANLTFNKPFSELE